jgi:hypothetical protein
MFLAVPTWLSFSYYVLKSGRYLHPDVLKDPDIGRKTTIILLLGMYTAGGYYVYVLFNLVFYIFRHVESAELLLAASYPCLRVSIRILPVGLVKIIAPDNTHDILVLFEILAALYNQILLLYIERLEVFLVLMFFSLFEQLFDVLRLTKWWRNVRTAYKKKFIKPYESKKNKNKQTTTDKPDSLNVNNNNNIKSARSDAKCSLRKVRSVSIENASVDEPPAYPSIVVGQMDKENHTGSKKAEELVIFVTNPNDGPVSNDKAMSVPSLGKRQSGSNYRVDVSRGTLDSVACSEYSNQSTHSDEKVPKVLAEEDAHSVKDAVIYPELSKAGHLQSTPILKHPIIMSHVSDTPSEDNKGALSASTLPKTLNVTGKSRTSIGPSRDTLASIAASDKIPPPSQSCNHMEQFVIQDKFANTKKKIPFKLECYNWHVCSSLAITTLAHLIAPPVYVVLFCIIYFIPYNRHNFTIVDEIPTSDVFHSFKYSAIHVGVQILVNSVVSFILWNKFGIDYKTPIALMVKDKKRFLMFAATLVYVITYQVMYKPYGLDISFQFSWVKQKLGL